MTSGSHTTPVTKTSIYGRGQLLASKLTPPVSRSHVDRLLILERFSLSQAPAKLVLISAAAGFGKTSLMAQYHAILRSKEVLTTWLTLDQADNDMERLLLYLNAAFNNIESSAGQTENHLPVSDVADDRAKQGTDITFRIATAPRPFVFFIDELETIQNPAAFEFFRLLLTHLPPTSSLVIGSRTIPNLGLARLRARDQLIQITATDLRFSLQETTEFLRNNRKLTLSDMDISLLQQRAEGWPAALQLASLSLASHNNPSSFIATFSSSNADITDYLAEDVFILQPPEVRDFLLRTCVLRELSAPLCNAVTGRTDGAILLDRLERENIFITQTDDRRREYRYHSLFAGFLKAQLLSEYPWVMTSLHIAASKWFAEVRRPIPAIEHALLSGDIGFSLTLLTSNAERLLKEGRFRLLARWFACIPKGELEPYPHLRIVFAWALTAIRSSDDAKAIIDGFIKPSESIRTWVVALRAYALTMEDKPALCLELCSTELTTRQAEMTTQYGSLTYFYANCLVAAGKFPEALRYLDESKRTYAGIESTVGVVITERVHGAMELAQGRLRDATMRLQRAYENSSSANEVSLSATVGVVLAVALYEGGNLSAAERLLNKCLALAKESGIPDILISGSVTLSRIADAQGRRDQALELLSDMENLGHQAQLPRLVANAWLERSRIALIDGDLSAAQSYLDNADNAELWNSLHAFSLDANDVETVTLSRLRLKIHAHGADSAVSDLKNLIKVATQSQRHHRVLKLKIMLAYGLYVCADVGRAMRTLKEALQLGCREGFISTFREEGIGVLEMIKHFRDTAADDLSDLSVFISTVTATPSLRTDYNDPGIIRAALSPDSEAIEHLTERESEVLTLLAKGLSNQELAKQLFVSESTIKTHLARINMKFGTHNRTQAIAAARNKGFLS